ncbi:MAG TPA: tetratricopeptide repeat protein [Rickettsia endosymbiont of Omalisus fontisbellaquei]|nr:tetratricopeptide repeat protein [Rickettsia endosymbiont of Omalisus fontisbellaquei]
MQNKKIKSSLEDKLQRYDAIELLTLYRSYARVGELTEAKIIRNYLEKLKCNNALEYYQKGCAFSKLNAYHQEALEAFSKAIELKPDYVEAYYMVGKNIKTRGKYEEAIKFFDKVIELEPSFLQAYLDKGWALCELEKYEEALEIFNKGIKFNPCIEELCSGKIWILNEIMQKKIGIGN